MNYEKQWHIIITKQQWELKVFKSLLSKKIEAYYPMKRVDNTWHHEIKTIYLPLFDSYIFVNIAEKDFSTVKNINGFAHVLYWHDKPAIINAADIECLKLFISLNKNIRVEKAIRQSEIKNVEQSGVTASGAIREKIFLPSIGYFLVAPSDEYQAKVKTPFEEGHKINKAVNF